MVLFLLHIVVDFSYFQKVRKNSTEGYNFAIDEVYVCHILSFQIDQIAKQFVTWQNPTYCQLMDNVRFSPFSNKIYEQCVQRMG